MPKTYKMSQEFIDYQEMIASSPVYADMPDLRNSDGSIQWEAPSNRTPGTKHADTHNRRTAWWKAKAQSIGIDTSQAAWISRTAKQIHPTKLHPCKYCGKVMSIEYCYLSANLIKKIHKVNLDSKKIRLIEQQGCLTLTTSIYDLVTSLFEQFGQSIFGLMPVLLKCKSQPDIPVAPDLQTLIQWLKQVYVPSEPQMLSPGTMSNAPDRLDGFHSFNRCCRQAQDSGRSKENLASYSSDRRAFANWSDGNWIEANKLMGVISASPDLATQVCRNDGDGKLHPRPCSADHIGPISLGFSHRPVFQLLCRSCNSAKNNRMYLSDVLLLIADEQKGENVVSWYAKSIWDILKKRIKSDQDALKLSKILRDNRHTAISLLDELRRKHQYCLLLSLLNLQLAEYSWAVREDTIAVCNHVVRASFSKTPSGLLYVNEQKARKIRVAFEALFEYHHKEKQTESARNGLIVRPNASSDCLNRIGHLLKQINTDNKDVIDAMDEVFSGKYPETHLYGMMPKISHICSCPEIKTAKDLLTDYMKGVADVLSSYWDAPRYNREQPII